MTILDAVVAAGLQIVDRVDFPERQATYRRLPTRLHPRLLASLRQRRPDGIYRHQAEALEHLLDGQSIVLSTATASGKSLVFMTAAAHQCLSHPDSKVLAIYPAKALIDDQLRHWQQEMASIGLVVESIHGGVATATRDALIRRAHIVLMTPDVVHAWLMRDRQTDYFLMHLRMLVLDEAHSYVGAFGTNMAYLLRRLWACSDLRQIIATTATLGGPERYIESLTGIPTIPIGPTADGSPSPGRTIVRVLPADADDFTSKVGLIQRLRDDTSARFLAFLDSRKSVAQVVVALERLDATEESDDNSEPRSHIEGRRVLPYRAGYEEHDRARIQEALRSGQLAGVVSTSALELGLDIGDIDAVVLLTSPQTMKSLWQRVGRAGRRDRRGMCIWFDDGRTFLRSDLQQVLARPIEPNHLYLDNRYIQFSHALCAAYEIALRGNAFRRNALQGLPFQFSEMIENELNPTVALPPDLMPIKVRAQNDAGPHWELPLRSGGEPTYQIVEKQNENNRLGTASLSQVLREAYPGAVYYYVTTAYRVIAVESRNRKVLCRREKRYITWPLRQTMVFPQMFGGVPELLRSEHGFLAECSMQVSERVIGFTEKRGGGKPIPTKYGAGCPYAMQPLGRTFDTTGVCWSCDTIAISDDSCDRIKRAYCSLFEVHDQDVGFGPFMSKQGLDNREVRGWCLYDATLGSLRLTRFLVAKFAHVVEEAALLAQAEGNDTAQGELELLLEFARSLSPVGQASGGSAKATPVAQALRVIGPQQAAVLNDEGLSRDVTVVTYRFGPKGLMYELLPHKGDGKWLVPADRILAIEGQTEFILVNADTGEELEA